MEGLAEGATIQRSLSAHEGKRPRARPRIALLHYTAPPIVGGVERVIGNQAALLREAGYDVRVIAGRGDAVLVPEADSRHPEVERLARRLASGRDAGSEFESLRIRLRSRLAGLLWDRDVVVAHNVMTMPFNLPLAAALLDLGRPVIAWTHDLLTARRERAIWAHSIAGRPQLGVIYVAISKVRRRQLAEAFGLPVAEIPVVPNGIDTLGFAGLDDRARQLLAGVGALEADPLVLVPQRVTRGKRLELAIDAAARLVRRLPGLRMLITGPADPHSPDSQAYGIDLLRRRSALGLDEAVRFLLEETGEGGRHPVDDEDIAQLYRISDAVLMTSASEGFGLPLLEAALARVPIVCTDLPVFHEVGGSGIHTFPVDGDGGTVAAALEAALNTEATRHRRTIRRRYDWSRLRTALERLVLTAVAKPAG